MLFPLAQSPHLYKCSWGARCVRDPVVLVLVREDEGMRPTIPSTLKTLALCQHHLDALAAFSTALKQGEQPALLEATKQFAKTIGLTLPVVPLISEPVGEPHGTPSPALIDGS